MMDSMHHMGAAARQFGWLLPLLQSIPEASVIKDLRERRREVEDRKLVTEFSTFKLEPRNVKRVASSKLEDENEKAKRQKKEWTTLTRLSFEIRKLTEQYKDNYGELDIPADLVEDLSL